MDLGNVDHNTLELWEDYRNKRVSDRILRCADALLENDFSVIAVPTASEANRSLVHEIPKSKKVYFWENPILEELGILDTLDARGNRLRSISPACSWLMESKKMKPMDRHSVFMSTVCAVSMNGMLVKIQPEGAPIFQTGGGPEKVILVIGFNSIVDTVHDGFRRAKDICIPQCAARFDLDLPCVKKEHCVECDEPPPACVVNTIVTRKPSEPQILVMIIGELLGL